MSEGQKNPLGDPGTKEKEKNIQRAILNQGEEVI
jgi:hypothetical protein